MVKELGKGGKLVWIAPSGGRDRPDPQSGDWLPHKYDPGAQQLLLYSVGLFQPAQPSKLSMQGDHLHSMVCAAICKADSMALDATHMLLCSSMLVSVSFCPVTSAQHADHSRLSCIKTINSA